MKSNNKTQIESKIYSAKVDHLKIVLNTVDAVFTPFSTISLEAAINKKAIGIYYPEDTKELDPTFATVTKRIAITEFISDMSPVICRNKDYLIETFNTLSKNSENFDLLNIYYDRSKKYCDLSLKPNEILFKEVQALI